MTKIYAISRVGGSVSIMYLVQEIGVDEWGPSVSYPSLSDELKKWADHETDVIGVREIAPGEISTDRDFREAWTDNGKLTVDMPKARAIHTDRLRQLRAPKLAALDVEMTRAYKDPARQESIEARRQALRDVTDNPAIATAKTPDELRAVLPAALRD
jgi:hypothetical protein